MTVRRAVVLLWAGLMCVHAIDLDVTTEYGRIHGKDEIDPGVSAFYGIPFASPPVNSLRFSSPIPPTPWSNTRDCTHDEYYHICPQFHITKKIFIGSEDCLYMNIYVPKTAPPPGGFPVMFWIYGGGFTIGDGYEFGFYRGKYLAATRDVIVVEHNYRLSALGLLALPELATESAFNSTGNYALQDQQEALAFVYRNIAQFSGNPKKIAIFGESAGAFSVCWHLVSPISAQYFSAAIMESGTCSAPEFFFSKPRAFLFGYEYAAGLGCNSTGQSVLECLRGKKVTELLNNSDWPDAGSHVIPPLAPVMPFGPAIDGSPHGLLARPLDLLQAGQFARVPVLLGSNLNEGSIFITAVGKIVKGVKLPLDDLGFNLTMRHFFNETTSDQIYSFYPLQPYKTNDARAAIILRDFFFTCSARRAARAVSSHGLPVFLYQFTQKLDNWPDYVLLGDYHSIELPFVFDHQWPPVVHFFGPNEQKLSNTMTLYWTNMAKYGTPNGKLDGELEWPAYSAGSDLNMVLEHPARTNVHLDAAQCDFWDAHYEKFYFD